MERIESFETMLADIKAQTAYETEQMEKLKAAGKRNPPPTGSFSEIDFSTSKCWTPTRNTD